MISAARQWGAEMTTITIAANLKLNITNDTTDHASEKIHGSIQRWDVERHADSRL
jgi:hypothetical protein